MITTKRYQKISKIGEGTYGEVYKAKDLSNGNMIAIKAIKLEIADEGIPSTALREISILKEIEHKNIIKLIDVTYQPADLKLELIFDYINTDLRKFYKDLDESKHIPIYQVKSIVY